MLAILAAGCLAAGCENGSIKSALSSAAASKSIGVSVPTISPPEISHPTLSPAALHAVRSAMDAERAPGAAGSPQGSRVPGLLQAFEASLRALGTPPSPGDPF